MRLVMTSLPLARDFQCLFTFALVFTSRWSAEIWQLRRCCKLPFLFPPPRQRAPKNLLAGYEISTKVPIEDTVFFYLVLETGLPFYVVIRVAQRFSHLQARAKAVPLFLSPAPGIKVTISRSAPTSTLLAELFIFCFLIILFPFGLYRFILTTGLLQPREVLSENVFLVLQPTISYNWCSSIQYVRVSFRKQFSGL